MGGARGARARDRPPRNAIGKDYLGSGFYAAAPSGSGFQFSLGGVLGIAASGVDGLEFNVLGLNFGVSPNGIKLPMVGRIGSFMPSAPVGDLEKATAPRAAPPLISSNPPLPAATATP